MSQELCSVRPKRPKDVGIFYFQVVFIILIYLFLIYKIICVLILGQICILKLMVIKT